MKQLALLNLSKVHIEGDTEEQIETATNLIMPRGPQMCGMELDFNSALGGDGTGEVAVCRVQN